MRRRTCNQLSLVCSFCGFSSSTITRGALPFWLTEKAPCIFQRLATEGESGESGVMMGLRLWAKQRGEEHAPTGEST